MMKNFVQLLRIRNSMKSLQQISWTISQFEKRYSVDEIDEELAKEVVDAYLEYVPQLERLVDELKDEHGKSTD